MTRDLIELLGFEDLSAALTFVVWIALFAIAAGIYAFYRAGLNRMALRKMRRQMGNLSEEVHHVDDNMTAMNHNVSHLQEEVERDIPRELHRMDERVDAAKVTALNVKDDIEDLEDTVEKLDTKVDDVSHEIEDMGEDVKDVHGNIKGVNNRIEEVRRDVDHVEREVDDVEHHVDVIAVGLHHNNNNGTPGNPGNNSSAQEIENLEIVHRLKKQRERIDDKIDSYLEFDDWVHKDEAYYDDLYDEARERYDDVRKYLTNSQIDAIEIDRKQVFAKKAALFETGVTSIDSEDESRAYHQAIKHMFITMRTEVVNRITQLERSQSLSA